MVISLSISLLVVVGYAVRSVLVFPWYAPLITVPTIIALAPVWRLGLRHQLCMTVLVLPQASAAILSALTPIAPQHSPLAPSGARAHTLLLIGQALSSIEPRLTIVAPEIGALGYGFRGDLIDAVGLASPASLTFHPLRVPEERQGGYQGAVPPQLVKNTQPDVVIGLPSLMYAVVRDPHLTNYTKIEIPITLPPPHERVPTTVWGNSHITVLVQNAKYEEVAQRLLNPLHPL
jgi:hypothetical protein